MSNVSHRDPDGSLPDGVYSLTGVGSPEGVVSAAVGSMFRRLDGTSGATLYIKEGGAAGNTGWRAVEETVDTSDLEAAVEALEAADVTLDNRLDGAETDITDLQAADVALEDRVNTLETDFVALDGVVGGALNDITALEGTTASLVLDLASLESDVISADASLDGRLDAIEANGWVTQARIGANEVTLAKLSDMAQGTVLGRSTAGVGDPEGVSLGGSLELPAGGLLRRAALTGDVTAAADSNSTTIADDAVTTAKILNSNVTLAKLSNISSQRFLGRTSASAGVVEQLLPAQATAMLEEVTTSAKGLVSTAPNVVRQVFRGNATWGVPKQTWVASFCCDTVTAGTTDRFLNPAGYSTSPAGTTGFFYVIPFTGNLVRTQVLMSTVHTTNTFTVSPQYDGAEATTQNISIAANVGTADTTHATPLPVVAGKALACRVDHNGATNVRFITVNFFIEES